MQIETTVFRKIVEETRLAERSKALDKMAEVMEWTPRFGGFDSTYRRRCAEVLYDGADCKSSGTKTAAIQSE